MFVAVSNFEVLIGAVELGQTQELMDAAARDGENVVAFVSNDRQTAAVSGGAFIRLDWLRWVDEVLGESADNATYTVHRTQLDESGNPIGAPTEFEGTEAIEVIFDPEADEYYIMIHSVITVAGTEDPDRDIYELEACLPNADASETCYRSNITVFALDIIEPLGN